MGRIFLAIVLMVNVGLFPFLGQIAGVKAFVSAAGISVNIPVQPRKQLKLTSCGEAVIAMAYHYAYPQTSVDERDILTYAEAQRYYNEKKWPFTSPANMLKIARHYTKDISTGAVSTSAEGLALLSESLRNGNPVIIDILTQLDNPRSGAHFVLVTGLRIPEDNKFAVTVSYNDPATGKNRSAPWYGNGGVWSAWHNNGDPGGAGWWLSIPVSAAEDLNDVIAR